ncbi:hypothetical protein OCOJLMKI_3716 [Methylobacterium iners]|uniref:Transcriptional regulator n=1 Tax=Methylobacterium iners TaxID=418707 RepID=A0ABQ4S481_9HYPH|nr:hypothetical protein OCOJLMKI_3716 [Methylobacterium iners]
MSPRNDAARALAERLVRETGRTLASIAAEAGVTERTVCV